MKSPITYCVIRLFPNLIETGTLFAQPRTAQEFGIMSIPTLLFKKDGQVVKQLAGVHTAQQIKELVAELS